jgi:hypothetical protein
MDDDPFVYVELVGGPMDGGQLPVDPSELADPAPGMDFVPEDGSGNAATPDGMPLGRVLYLAREGEDPAVWHWQGWVP